MTCITIKMKRIQVSCVFLNFVSLVLVKHLGDADAYLNQHPSGLDVLVSPKGMPGVLKMTRPSQSNNAEHEVSILPSEPFFMTYHSQSVLNEWEKLGKSPAMLSANQVERV